jgi:hypothetical protein
MITFNTTRLPLSILLKLTSRRVIALALVCFLLHAPQLLLAQVSGISGGQPGTPMALHIVILDGENALNNIRQRTAREPIVQVEDENHKPVAGATVLFTIRRGKTGAGGSFSGAATITVTTGANGQAVASGLLPNTIQGAYTISVTASVGAATTSAIITQTNVLGVASSTTTQSSSTTTNTTSTTTATHVAHHLGVHFLTAHLWAVVGTAAVASAVVVTTVVLTKDNGATITAGTGTVKP